MTAHTTLIAIVVASCTRLGFVMTTHTTLIAIVLIEGMKNT